MLLSVSLSCPCGRWWQAFEGARLPMQAPKYSLSQSSFSTKSNSRVLVAVLLTPWYKPRYFECLQPCTPYCYQPQIWNPATYHLFAPSLWYFVSARIHERCHKSFISWAIWACKFICLLGIILKKDSKTWLPACNSA